MKNEVKTDGSNARTYPITPSHIQEDLNFRIQELIDENNDLKDQVASNNNSFLQKLHLMQEKLNCSDSKLIRQKAEYDRELALFLARINLYEEIVIHLVRFLGKIDSKTGNGEGKAFILELEGMRDIPSFIIEAYYKALNSNLNSANVDLI